MRVGGKEAAIKKGMCETSMADSESDKNGFFTSGGPELIPGFSNKSTIVCFEVVSRGKYRVRDRREM